MATDWAALRVEYVSGAVTLRELAQKHGIKAAGVMRRAANEKWDEQRKQASSDVSKRSLDLIAETKAETLARINAADMNGAEQIRQKALEMLQSAADPADLKALAGAMDIAQKISRLAIGAATEKLDANVQTRELPASVDDFV